MEQITVPVWTEEKMTQEEMSHPRLSMIKNRAFFEMIALRDYMFDSFPGLTECTVYTVGDNKVYSCGELYSNEKLYEELDSICLGWTLEANLDGSLFNSLREIPASYASATAVFLLCRPMMEVFGEETLENLGQVLQEFSNTGMSSGTFINLLEHYSPGYLDPFGEEL